MMSKKELEQLAEKLKSIPPFPRMPLEIFQALQKLLPMAAVELFVVRDDGSFALLERKGEFNGWALPGGYMGLNETFEDACRRIAQKELGVKLKSIEFVYPFNWPEGGLRKAKGHAISFLFKCTAENDSSLVRYFSTKPEGILKHHAFMLDKLGVI